MDHDAAPDRAAPPNGGGGTVDWGGAADHGDVDELLVALKSRAVIGQAQGLLMVRHNVSADAALAILAQRSQDENVEVRHAAAKLVADADAEVVGL